MKTCPLTWHARKLQAGTKVITNITTLKSLDWSKDLFQVASMRYVMPKNSLSKKKALLTKKMSGEGKRYISRTVTRKRSFCVCVRKKRNMSDERDFSMLWWAQWQVYLHMGRHDFWTVICTGRIRTTWLWSVCILTVLWVDGNLWSVQDFKYKSKCTELECTPTRRFSETAIGQRNM